LGGGEVGVVVDAFEQGAGAGADFGDLVVVFFDADVGEGFV